MKNNKQNILKAFNMRKEGKSLTQIEKATGIKRPYVSFLFKNFTYDEIELIVKNQDLIQELKENLQKKNNLIKKLKSQLENCTCWEELSFLKKIELMIKYLSITFLIGGILGAIGEVIVSRVING